MHQHSQLKPNLPLWQRIAALFSLIAIASALLAPSALLAEDVRTGKLAGLCGISNLSSSNLADSDDASVQAHCDACTASIGVPVEACKHWVLVGAGQAAVKVGLPSDLPAGVDGLPPSRGPPSL